MARLSERDLAIVGWSIRELSRRCGWSEFSVRQMVSGARPTPPGLLRWLQEEVEWRRSHPPTWREKMPGDAA